jgi:hypothetical protein
MTQRVLVNYKSHIPIKYKITITNKVTKGALTSDCVKVKKAILYGKRCYI